ETTGGGGGGRDPYGLGWIRFGAMGVIPTPWGVARRSTDVRSALRQPDLPEPVVPAMSRCGIRARSVQTAAPEMSFPSQTETGLAVAGSGSKMSPRVTRFGERFGSSTPTACLPGIGARMRI